jgi:hypothetical protein
VRISANQQSIDSRESSRHVQGDAASSGKQRKESRFNPCCRDGFRRTPQDDASIDLGGP